MLLYRGRVSLHSKRSQNKYHRDKQRGDSNVEPIALDKKTKLLHFFTRGRNRAKAPLQTKPQNRARDMKDNIKKKTF
jgi:hypothetical protein